MKYGINLELTYEYKRFSFDSRSSTFKHNETGLTKKVVLDYFGNKLKSHAVIINDTKFLKGAYDDFNELFGILYQDKIGPNEPDRKYFIKKYQQIVDDITIKILSNPENINDDFDFDELDEMPQLNLDDEATGTLTDDFDFDEIEIDLPAAETEKPITKVDEFDFSEFDETSATVKNSPTFFIHNDEYKLFINFKHMTFTASGKDRLTVYALQNLATLVFINHEFLTANIHPEWLYSVFEDDLTIIFNKLTSDYIYLIEEEKAAADKYLEQEFLRALLNYRNKVEFFKNHRPHTFKNQ